MRKDEKIKGEIIKILSEYKVIYLRKKQEVIKNFFKLIFSKEVEAQTFMLSSISQLSILS